MPMLAMMDAIMLLGELSPYVPRNFSFMAFDADDQELTVGANKGRDLTVPQLGQENARHSHSHNSDRPLSRSCGTDI